MTPACLSIGSSSMVISFTSQRVFTLAGCSSTRMAMLLGSLLWWAQMIGAAPQSSAIVSVRSPPWVAKTSTWRSNRSNKGIIWNWVTFWSKSLVLVSWWKLRFLNSLIFSIVKNINLIRLSTKKTSRKSLSILFKRAVLNYQKNYQKKHIHKGDFLTSYKEKTTKTFWQISSQRSKTSLALKKWAFTA